MWGGGGVDRGNGAGTWYVRQLAVTNDNGDSVSWRRARRAVRNGNGIVVEREKKKQGQGRRQGQG